jgi:anti-sigma factor RsiW
MAFTPLPISDEDLHGFIDNELDDERRESVLAYLAAVPTDAARAETWRQQTILLRAAFSQVALEQVPASLIFSFAPRLITLPSFVPSGPAARDAYTRRVQRRNLAFTIAAFIAGVCITLAASVSLSRYSVHSELTAGAAQGPALAHVAASALKPVDEAEPISPDSVTLAGAVEPALGILPSLKDEGLELVRGEFRGKGDDAATCLDFVDAARAPVVLCITAAKVPGAADVQSLAIASSNSLYWREGASLYALAAPFKSAKLIALARRIHAALPEQPPE